MANGALVPAAIRSPELGVSGWGEGYLSQVTHVNCTGVGVVSVRKLQ